MFSMSPTLNNSLQSLYNQYSGPQSGGSFNPNQPLWMQSQGLQTPQLAPAQNPALTGPALASSNAQLPGMQTNPGINPNILHILQMMMSGNLVPPGTVPPPGTTPGTGGTSGDPGTGGHSGSGGTLFGDGPGGH